MPPATQDNKDVGGGVLGAMSGHMGILGDCESAEELEIMLAFIVNGIQAVESHRKGSYCGEYQQDKGPDWGASPW